MHSSSIHIKYNHFLVKKNGRALMAKTIAKKESLMTRLDKILVPIGQKLGNEKHLQAISNGMLFGLPFLVIGSFFLIVANPPIVLDKYNLQLPTSL